MYMSTEATKFFAIRTTARQEVNVALMIELVTESRKREIGEEEIYSVIVPPGIKGYIILEAPGLHAVYNVIRGLKHIKGRASGALKWEDVERFVVPKPVIEIIKEGDIVEIVAGPFRGLQAKIVAIDKEKNEVVLNILEAAYPLQITVPADYIRPAKRG